MANVNVRFLPDDVVVEAEPGEALLTVARRAGQSIPTGCLRGSCHACVVESDCWGTICACITAIPDHDVEIELWNDPTW